MHLPVVSSQTTAYTLFQPTVRPSIGFMVAMALLLEETRFSRGRVEANKPTKVLTISLIPELLTQF